jgi:ABC-type nitrate/sulfonate/bicarbonate transport system ATPase subunit/flavin-dependent dehydrogenase
MTFPGNRVGEAIPVLQRVNLEVRAGEFVCIVGPSGCGKSTLLNIVGGFLQQTRGEAIIEGEPVKGPDPRRIFVFQENGVFPWLTVEENISFGLLKKSEAERRQIVMHYLEMVGLRGFERAYPRELSGGMRQRAELARALAASPDIIYMDEPFGALDFITRLKMRADLTRIWQTEKKTILFVTHDIEEAVQLADRVLVMSQRPATIQTIIEVDLPRPRDLDSADYLATRDRIFAAMGMSLRIGDSTSAADEDPMPPHGSTPNRDPAPKAHEGARSSAGAQTQLSASGGLDAQVIIIGGGPAGSTLGAYLARAGIHHLILDQAVHPRPHVGESLVCSTTRIFQDIDFLPVMEREQFAHKHGAVWTHWTDQREHVIRFREIPGLGLTQDYTYHVDRSRFDQLLLRHAARQGSQVLEGARVERVEFGPDGAAIGVRMKQNGETRLLRSKLVVDASGRSTVLGSQLRLKRNDPLFNQFAVHNWFAGVDRGPAETSEYIHIHILPMPRAWVWLIPLNQTTTSVGIVTESADFAKGTEPVEEFFARHIASHPLLARRMAKARPIHDFSREGNYSYVMDRFAGKGWLLVGDAARFVDPVFSSGVSVAMESAKRAADAIIRALARDDLSAASFADYERTVRAGVDIWREFIVLYYQLPPLFLDLISRPDARRQLTQLLQGDVYHRAAVPILEQMRATIKTVAENANHPWHAHLSASALASAKD